MTKKCEWSLAALVVFLGATTIAVCRAQAPPVTGVCVANCGSGSRGNTNTTTHAEARAYSSYVRAYNQALKQYQQAIRVGSTAQGLSLCQSAQNSVDVALQYAPGDGDALLLRHRIIGCIDACNGVFSVKNGEYDRGIAFYRQAESDDPADRGLWEQGIAWAESARRQAIADAQAKAAADREHATKAQVDALWERGAQLRKSGDYKAEEAIWRQVIALNPSIPEAYSNLGTAIRGQGRLTDSLEAYQKATQLNPKDADSQYWVGCILMLDWRYTEAETALRRALQLNPNNWNAETDLGRTLWGLGRPVEAEAAYQKAIQMNPRESFPQYELGIMLEHQKRYAEAEAAYRRALELSPGDADYQHALEYVKGLEAKAQQQGQASHPAMPLITAGENLKDAPNSGGGSGTGDASNSSPSQKALDEANSTRGATVQGLQSTTPEGKTTGRREDAVAGGSKIFDTAGQKIAAPPVDLRGVGKAPAVAKLLSHIPQNDKVKNDQMIKASIDWYSKLESDKAEIKQNIADLQKQIDNKQGNRDILKMEQTQYTNNLKIIQQNQQRAEDAIKKQLKNLSMPWIEEPDTPASDKKTGTSTKEKQP